jgi:tetratricopeptide (TPR) repeat protein/TolB-like protein
MMNTTTRVTITLAVSALAACAAAPPGDQPAVVVLSRAGKGSTTAESELATGLALEAAHWLSRSPHVIVRTPSTSSSAAGATFAEVNDRLAVDMVVWLAVRDSGDRSVVRWVLETKQGEARAAQSFTGDLFAIPAHIAGMVLKELADRKPPPPWPPPASPAVYAEFLRTLARAHTRDADETRRVELYEKLPPGFENYPPAVTELGNAYLDLAGKSAGTAPYYGRAEQTLKRALQLDTLYPPARQLLASYFAKHGESEKSLRLLHDGIRRHQHYPGYYDQLGYVLRYAGWMDASIENYRRAQELDRSLQNLVSSQDQITKSLIYLGRYREALASHERMESFVTRLGAPLDEKEWFYKGVIRLYAGDRDQALAAFRRGQALDSTSVWTTFGRGYAGIARGDRAAVAQVLAALERHVVIDGERHYRLVHFTAFLGETQQALQHLETAIRGGFFNAPYIATDPLTATLRSHARFGQLLKEANQRHTAFQGASRTAASDR